MTGRTLTLGQISAARRHREEDPKLYTWTFLAKQFGVHRDTVRRAIDPTWKLMRCKQIQAARPSRAKPELSPEQEVRCGIVAQHLRDRKAADAALIEAIPHDDRDLCARLMGDPVFERSALYAKRGDA